MQCKYCGNISDKTFCDENCRGRYRYRLNEDYREKKKKSSNKTYYKYRNNNDFKAKKRESFDRWRIKNREKWNAQMREVMRRRKLRLSKK